VPVDVPLLVDHAVPDGDGVPVFVAVSWGVADSELVGEAVAAAVPVAVPIAVPVPVRVFVRVVDAVTVAVAVRNAVLDAVEDGDDVCVPVRLGVSPDVVVAVGS